MSKITLSTVSELQAFPSAAANINSNSATLTTAMDNTISRDGTSPNAMNAALDMNSHRIVNLPAPIASTEPVRVVDLVGGSAVTVNNLPVGGTTAQVLAKNSGTNFDVLWNSSGLPTGGTVNQVLKKNSSTNYDASWSAPAVTGDVVGPGSATDKAAVRFSTTTGKLIQDSALNIADTTATLTRTGGGGIPLQGTNTNDSAGAGFVGEYASNEVTYAGRFAMSNATSTTVTTLSLTAGDWDVNAVIGFETSGGGVATEYHIEISTTPPPALVTAPNEAGTVGTHVSYIANQGQVFPVGPRRVSVNALTTVYLKAYSSFSGSQTVYGFIRARRMR